MKKVHCIDEYPDGSWKIYTRGSAIPRGSFDTLEDAVAYIEGHMGVEKKDYRINPRVEFPEIIQAQETP